MNLFTTRIDCEVAGQWRAAGVPFSLTDAQAVELMPPRGGVVAPYVPPDVLLARLTRPLLKETPNAGLGRNKRRNRKAAH